MEIHAIQGDTVTHVMTTHRVEGDVTPLQMISGAKLAYYVAIEQALMTFVESLGNLLPAPPAQ